MGDPTRSGSEGGGIDGARSDTEDATSGEPPDSSQMVRRGALVPPKMEGMHDADDEEDILLGAEGGQDVDGSQSGANQ